MDEILRTKHVTLAVVEATEEEAVKRYMEREPLIVKIPTRQNFFKLQNEKEKLMKERKNLAEQLIAVEQKMKDIDKQILNESLEMQRRVLTKTEGGVFMRFKSMTNEELSKAICNLRNEVESGKMSLHEAMKKATVYDKEIKKRNRKIFRKKKWWKFWG